MFRNFLSRTVPPALFSLCFLFAGSLSAQTTQIPADAKTLAQAMQASEQSRMGIEASIQNAIKQGKSTEKVLECSRADELAFTTNAYAEAIAAALSADEIQQATTFFASPAGKAYLEYSRSLEFQQRGIPDAKPRKLSGAEERATRKFLQASAGKKLLEDRVLETPQLRAALTRGMVELVSKCSAK